MMKPALDFWNNPLVVSATRLKFRRGSPGLIVSLYVLTLCGLGMGIVYYQDAMLPVPPGRAFLLAVFGIQFLLSGTIALFSVAGSINMEVASRTLDFQRIVSLSPREILIGKILGEPMLGHFLALSTMPLAIICWAWGAATAWTILWFYMNLVTFVFLCGTIGSLHTLVPSTKSSFKQQNSGSLIGWLVAPMFFLPSLAASGVLQSSDSWVGTFVHLLTPIGSLAGMKDGEAWAAQVKLWHFGIPSLCAAPVVQMVLAWLLLGAMARRMKNTLLPLLTKRQSMIALLVVDCIMAGVCYSRWIRGIAANNLLFEFMLGHVGVALFLMLLVTPSRAGLMSWIWRFRGRQTRLVDLMVGDRSVASFVLPMFCAIGAIVLLVGFVVPSYSISNSASGSASMDAYVEAMGLMTVLLLSLGVAYQWCIATQGSSGTVLFVVALLVLNLVPPMIAALAPEVISREAGRFIINLSPFAYGIQRAGGSVSSAHGWAWLLSIYGGVLLVFRSLLRRWIAHQQIRVDARLEAMGVTSIG